MIRKIRLILTIFLLVVSLTLLVIGFLPNPRETRIQEIPPAEMQLPTPSSLHFDFESAA